MAYDEKQVSAPAAAFDTRYSHFHRFQQPPYKQNHDRRESQFLELNDPSMHDTNKETFLMPPPALRSPNRNTGTSIASNATAHIAQQLQSGAPVFIDVDRVHDGDKCPNVRTDEEAAESLYGIRANDCEREMKGSKILRILTFGIPIDAAARGVLMVAFLQAVLSFLSGVDMLSNAGGNFRFQRPVIAGAMLAFGFYVSSVCLNGFTLMWSSHYRKSPLAATIFMVNCFLSILAVGAATFLWIFFAAKPISCDNMAVNFAPGAQTPGMSNSDSTPTFVFSDEITFQQRPLCLRRWANVRRTQIFWGAMMGVTTYYFIVLSLWSIHYRKRVLLARLLEEVEGEETDDVGLVITSAPGYGGSPMREKYGRYGRGRGYSEDANETSLVMSGATPIESRRVDFA